MRNSEFFKNILVLFSGTLISQLIPFILLPILLKYFYQVSDFGVLAIFISTADLLGRVATLKLEFGIVIQKRTKNSINLATGALKISWIIALASLIVVLLFKKSIAQYIDEPRLENFLFLIPLYVLLVSFNDVATYWFNRAKNFKVISFSKIVLTGGNETSKLIFGVFNGGFIGLIVSRIIGIFTSNLYLFSRFFKGNRKELKLLNYQQQKKIVAENRAFMLFSTPSVFIGFLINFVYLNLFLVYFGKESVGAINISMAYITAGYGMLALSFSQVYYSKLAEINDATTLLQLYTKFLKKLVMLSLVPVVVVYAIPNQWIAMILGEKWVQFFEIIRIMSLWLSVWFVSSSLSFIYIKLGKQRVMMLYDIVHLLLVCVGFFTAYGFYGNFIACLWGFTFAQIAFYVFVILLAIRFIKHSKLQEEIC